MHTHVVAHHIICYAFKIFVKVSSIIVVFNDYDPHPMTYEQGFGFTLSH